MLNSRFRTVAIVAAAATIAACLAACSAGDFTRNTVCAGVGYVALDVVITDQYGRGQALGATVTLTDGDYSETDSVADTLHITGAMDRGGRTYDIRVSKPYYNDVVVRGVKTRGGGCVTGHEDPPVTSTVPVTLALVPGAPPLRAIRILPPRPVLLDRPPHSSAFTPSVTFDADPGVSRGVVWSIAGDTSFVGFDKPSGTVIYHCSPKHAIVTLTARAVANPAIRDFIVVRTQGHPATETDPPC